MRAVIVKAAADLRRRRTQTAVLTLVLFLASAAGTLALDILVAANEPFERAFSTANGAHLVVDFRGSVDEESVVSAGDRLSVTAVAGPWPVATGGIGSGGVGMFEDQRLSSRADPLGAVDRIDIAEGRWWRSDDEAVVSWDTAQVLALRIGDPLVVYAGAPKSEGEGGGGPIVVDPGRKFEMPDPLATLTIVGIARSVSAPDEAAWVSHSVVDAVAGDTGPDQRMLYRLAGAPSAADLTAAVNDIASGLPTGAVAGTSTYLDIKAGVEDTARLYVPILLAFAAFALLAAAFTIANVVSGIVLTGYREIGVMKAVGFTPGQVTAILEAQALVPALVGSIAGVAAGTVASVSTVERLTESFGLPPSFAISVPVVVGVVATSVTLAALAAVVPALQAGRLSAAHAIARGSAPSRGVAARSLGRLAGRLPASLPIRLGAASGAAHPLRSVMTLGAVVVGVAAATFALGVNLSLIRIIDQLDRTTASPVRAEIVAQNVDPAAVTAAIAANPDTERFVAIGQTSVDLGGLGEVLLVGYDGDFSGTGYETISGRLPSGPGEVAAGTNFFRRGGFAVGDTVEIVNGDLATTVTLVGELFDTGEGSDNPLVLRATMDDVLTVDPAAAISRWEIKPQPSVPPDQYAEWLGQATDGAVGTYTLGDSTQDEEFLLFLSVVAGLGIVLVVMSFGGVFNTVLLETKQRTRELAVLKAVGMAPRQVVAMVIAAVAPIGLVAGLLGVPIGLALQRAVLSYMGETFANTNIPERSFDVFGPVLLALLTLGGLAIAAVGAWLPAQRAARARIAPVLQAE
jgi:putative ABC transport system permease protein